jgi:hypothetical protein
MVTPFVPGQTTAWRNCVLADGGAVVLVAVHRDTPKLAIVDYRGLPTQRRFPRSGS